MLRVLKACNSFNNFQALNPQVLNLNRRKLRCSLCNEVTDHTIVGGSVFHLFKTYSSTVAAHVLTNEKKKRRRKKTSYTELLEVSEKKTSEKKTKIKTLTANTLHKINGDNLTINFDLDAENKPSDESLALSEMVEKHGSGEMDTMEISYDPQLITESAFEAIDRKETLRANQQNKSCKRPRPLTKDSREKLARVRISELEKIGKEKCLNSSLVSYVELCMSCGFLNRGWYTLKYYLNKKNIPVSDIRIFNTLFDGFSQKGMYDKLMEIWHSMIDSAKLNPNAISYAKRFEAIVRSAKRDKSELLYSCLREMEGKGISVEDIFKEAEWKRDSREVVLSAIRVVRPSFTPKIQDTNAQYTCDLVNHLNQPSKTLASPAESLFSADDLKELFREQFDLEMKTYVRIKSIDAEKNTEMSPYTKYCRKQLEKLESSWEKCIYAALNRDISAMFAIHKHLHRSGSPINIYPYLVVLNKCDYVDIIMHEVRKLAMGSETYSPTAAILCKNLGNLVKMRYDIKSKQSDGILEKVEKIYHEYLNWYIDPNGQDISTINPRQTWQLLSHKFEEGPSLDTESEPWPHSVLTAIGKFLYNIILKDVKINVNILRQNSKSQHFLPAFYTVFRYQSNLSCEEVKPHPILYKLYRLACIPDLVFSAADLPMLSPPLPWSSIRTGGYLLAKAPIIRLPSSAIAQRDRLKEAPPNQLYPCFDSLNQLGSIPWKVNTKILDIVVKLFNSGGNEKLNVPPPPPPPSTHPLPEQSSKEEKYEAFKARLQDRRRRAEMYSLWCDALYRLSLAHHYRDRVFWLPHNMDFRGRVYPCPPHLSHLGSDLYRSLIVFAQKQPLGEKGLMWLKLHTINLTGLKKRESIHERLKYAEEILPKIIDSANDPMKEGSWWMESEEPWQTLAACIELRDALSAPGGPESYLSSFPIHQDGSCNGLQHYAAIGRDSAGAASVNLAPAPVPQDVYSCVAAIVDRERAKDASNGHKVAMVLDGFVRRKVIKQTVMTTVYGVTRFGARLQIAKQLRDIDDFPKEHVWAASQYLVAKTFDSIREMFTSTREIQDWFTETAQQISGVRGESVEYITPLGLPVVQPYSKGVHNKTYYTLSGKCSIFNKFDKYERPNVMKQKNAFPPNFIHSLDSSHMMLTSLHCQSAGITFVSVHDCFWTHANTVDIMNKICREQFVSLHSQPILEDLSRFMITRYGYDEDDSSDTNLPPSAVRAKNNLTTLLKRYPNKGDFELEHVLNSVYFFS